MVLYVFLFALLILFLVFFLYSYWIEPNRVLIEKESLFSQKIRGEITILQISDLHLYRGMNQKRILSFQQAVRKINEEKIPDLVFLTGDAVDKNSGLELLPDVLGSLKSKYGIYAVLGNHDYFQYHVLHLFFPSCKKFDRGRTDTERLIRIYRSLHIQVLRNEAKHLTLGENEICLIGLEMENGKKAKLPNGINFESSNENLKIVLSHFPDVIRVLKGKADLVFSGHTHGGQLTLFGFPLTSRSSVKRRHSRGLSQHRETYLWVSKGVGVSYYLPFRFFASPDIALITLRGESCD